MMKKFYFTLATLLLMVSTALAKGNLSNQTETEKFITPSGEIYTANGSSSPIITITTHSKVQVIYESPIYTAGFSKDDLITGISLKGFYDGETHTRHIKIWMQSSDDYRDYRWGEDFRSTEDAICVYDDDYVVRPMGDSLTHADVIDIDFQQPFALAFTYRLVMTIECTGAKCSKDVVVENNWNPWICTRAIAGSSGELGGPAHIEAPIAYFKIKTPVVYAQGTVFNQDQVPVPTAKALLHLHDNACDSAYTDSAGKYCVRVRRGNASYVAIVSAQGYATFKDGSATSVHHFFPKEMPMLDFTIYDAVTFKAGQVATLVLPVQPDPSVGKYYRMDRVDSEGYVIFTRELTPLVNAPYVFILYCDYTVDLKNLNLDITPGTYSLDYQVEDGFRPNVTFMGSYSNHEFYTTMNDVCEIIDETPDCEAYWYGGRVGAIHAALMRDYAYTCGYRLEELRTGDINGDGSINVTDVTILLDHILNGESNTELCDLNGDGTVNVTDVSALISLILGT